MIMIAKETEGFVQLPEHKQIKWA